MSDKPISKGDLVVHIRLCCDGRRSKLLGRIGVIRGLHPVVKSTCPECGTSYMEARAIAFSGYYDCAPLSQLIRIDPPALSEDVPTKEELTA